MCVCVVYRPIYSNQMECVCVCCLQTYVCLVYRPIYSNQMEDQMAGGLGQAINTKAQSDQEVLKVNRFVCVCVCVCVCVSVQ